MKFLILAIFAVFIVINLNNYVSGTCPNGLGANCTVQNEDQDCKKISPPVCHSIYLKCGRSTKGGKCGRNKDCEGPGGSFLTCHTVLQECGTTTGENSKCGSHSDCSAGLVCAFNLSGVLVCQKP